MPYPSPADEGGGVAAFALVLLVMCVPLSAAFLAVVIAILGAVL